MWLAGCAHPRFQGPCPGREAGDPGSAQSGPGLWPEFGDFAVYKMQISMPASLSCGSMCWSRAGLVTKAFVNCKVLRQ